MTARILLVEDNPPSRLLVRDILSFRGHEVIEAASVAEALAYLSPPPDLVLMDLEIPGGGGELVLRKIRDDPALRSLPVLVVTASAMVGDRERLLGSGFDGYMSKPIDTRSFGPTVEAFLGKGGDRSAAPPQG